MLRQLLLSFVHIAAQNTDSPQHRAAGWRFIKWNEVEQREPLAEAKRFLETGELFPRGTAEEIYALDAEAEATDSEPEAHVLEPLADDHSRERAAMSLLERLQACTGANHQRDYTLPLCRAQKESCGAQSRTRSQGISKASPGRACMSVSIASIMSRRASCVIPCQSRPHRLLLVQKELSFVVASLSIRSSRCFHVSSRSSPVPSLALRMGSNDRCDGKPCCPSFGGSPHRHHQGWSLRLDLPQHVKTHQVLTQ